MALLLGGLGLHVKVSVCSTTRLDNLEVEAECRFSLPFVHLRRQDKV